MSDERKEGISSGSVNIRDFKTAVQSFQIHMWIASFTFFFFFPSRGLGCSDIKTAPMLKCGVPTQNV